MSLSLGLDRESVKGLFERELDRPVRLVMTENSSSLFSARPTGEGFSIRLHNMFLDADDRVILELAKFAKLKSNDRAANTTPLFREFVKNMRHRIKRNQAGPERLRTVGRRFDLNSIFNKINSEYFDNSVVANITWGKANKKRGAHKRTLGAYYPDTGLIRINPVLDRPRVPLYYVEFVVYHEMLHAEIEGMGRSNVESKCRRLHTPEFKRRERMFKDFDRAMAYERGGG